MNIDISRVANPAGVAEADRDLYLIGFLCCEGVFANLDAASNAMSWLQSAAPPSQFSLVGDVLVFLVRRCVDRDVSAYARFRDFMAGVPRILPLPISLTATVEAMRQGTFWIVQHGLPYNVSIVADGDLRYVRIAEGEKVVAVSRPEDITRIEAAATVEPFLFAFPCGFSAVSVYVRACADIAGEAATEVQVRTQETACP